MEVMIYVYRKNHLTSIVEKKLDKSKKNNTIKNTIVYVENSQLREKPYGRKFAIHAEQYCYNHTK